MTSVATIQLIGAALFGLAVLHTFSTRYFEHLAHARGAHAGLWHLLGEVETVFGFWAIVLLAFMALAHGWRSTAEYLDSRQFVEPMFVFVIMVMAASRPIMQTAADAVHLAARALPVPAPIAVFFTSLALLPLLGSFITEPAAMTVAALLLRNGILSPQTSTRLKYATVGVLFVNVSIGGTLTSFAAPPVLMVASKWGWTSGTMLATFGWKAALAVIVNALVLTLVFREEIARRSVQRPPNASRVPMGFVLVNLALLAAVVFASHDPEVFMGLFLVFLGLAEAYKRYHTPLMLREGLMVAFFLAGLVVLGGQQGWWLQEVLARLSDSSLFYGATALTAITDNAALTYLGSLVEDISDAQKYALVAGAVAGGGLTVIANAPNPAGFAILKDAFDDGAIGPLGLLLAALPPTLVAVACLRGLDGVVLEMLDPTAWWAWLVALAPPWRFMLALPFVVAIVAFATSRSQRRE